MIDGPLQFRCHVEVIGTVEGRVAVGFTTGADRDVGHRHLALVVTVQVDEQGPCGQLATSPRIFQCPLDGDVWFQLVCHVRRVSDAWDINLELRGLLMKDAFGGTSKEGMAGVTVGVTYKFKKRGFNAVPTVPMVPESQLDDMRNRLNSLKGENESLKRDLVEARNKKPEVIVKKEGGFVPRLVVVFNIGKSNISKREYMNIEAMAKGIKANPEKTFTVTGYADKGTGSAEYNMKLSKKRAEAVRDLMVNEFGVPASQLKVDYKGGVGNMFYDDAKLSRVAIVEE